MRYGVKFVQDDELPEAHDFVLVNNPECVVIFMKEGRITEMMLERAWAAYRSLDAGPSDVHLRSA